MRLEDELAGPASRPQADPWLAQAPLVEEALASGALKLVFVFGTARSGTTWLQQLLVQHPAVGSLGETHLFNAYLSGVPSAWDSLSGKHVGLDRLLTEEEERQAWRSLALRALLGGRVAWADHRAVVEKTPAHMQCWELIRWLLPEAYMLHLVRDPRAVVASWKAAGRGWARDWAAFGSIDVAYEWVDDVSAGPRIMREHDRYRLVRYEQLHTDGHATLSSLFAWLGLDATPGECATYLDACRIERLRARGWPEGFFRKGLVDGWRDDLTRREVARIERVAGALMSQLGYSITRRHHWPLPSLWLHGVGGRLERGSARLARRLRL